MGEQNGGGIWGGDWSLQCPAPDRGILRQIQKPVRPILATETGVECHYYPLSSRMSLAGGCGFQGALEAPRGSVPCPMPDLKAAQRRTWLAGAKSLMPQACCVLDLSRDLAGCLASAHFPHPKAGPRFRALRTLQDQDSPFPLVLRTRNKRIGFFSLEKNYLFNVLCCLNCS